MEDQLLGVEYRRWAFYALFGIYQVVINIIPLILVMLTIHYWNDFTPCFQREVFILNCLILYWKFAKKQYGGLIFWEITQFTILFWVVQIYNIKETSDDSTCLDPEGYLVLTIIHLSYLTVLYTLTVVGLIFAVFFLGFIVYVLIDETILVPRRRREMGLNDEQFGKLKEITYAAPPMTQSRSGVLECAICLNEFADQDKLTELPTCEHKFHTKCIREWLKENRICPYCRSDVKHELGIDDLQENMADPPSEQIQGAGDEENPSSLNLSISGNSFSGNSNSRSEIEQEVR
jgi:Ring finger domain